MIRTANIFIWDEFVGAVLWNEAANTASFEYDAKFIQKKWELAPLKMPLSNSRRIFAFPELSGNETNCMIGFHSVSVILDAYVKGVIDKSLLEKLYPRRIPSSSVLR